MIKLTIILVERDDESLSVETESLKWKMTDNEKLAVEAILNELPVIMQNTFPDRIKDSEEGYFAK